MQDASRSPIQPLGIRPPQVCQPDLAVPVWDDDLPRVQVTGENEVEDTGLEPVDHVREVAEQDAEVGVGIGEPLGPRRATTV